MQNWGNSLVELSVRRPILITVLNVLIMLLGFAAIPGLDVRELPDVDHPVVTVRAELAGASPLTMDTEVTSEIENAVARVPRVKEIRSSSEEHNMRVRIEFNPGVNLHESASEVREAVSRVQRELPDEVDEISVLQADADSQPIIQLAVFSNKITIDELIKRVERELTPRILSIDGVADVTITGEQARSLQIKLKPNLMAANNVSVANIVAALNNASFDVPAGNYKSSEQDLIVRAFATLTDAEKLRRLHIKGELRLEDIADVFFAPAEVESFSLFNGRMVAGLGVIRQSGANTIHISNEVTSLIQAINNSNPGYTVIKGTDDADYIRSALKEVIIALVAAIIIVLALIALFLNQLRAVFIPATTIPISLIGALAAIWMFGFSINLLTLLGLVLATGLIVDDAIVVIENIYRKRQEGLGPLSAAIVGTKEVFFAVIATTASLIAVFIPIAFLPGETGILFREFALVLSVSVFISAFVALTLCAMLSSKLPPEDKTKLKSATHAKLKKFGSSVSKAYFSSLEEVLQHRYVSLGISLAIAFIALCGFVFIDKELVPTEDRGIIRIMLTGPDGASLSYSNQQAHKVEEILYPYQQDGKIKDIYTTVGRWDKNRSDIIATLNDWSQRDYKQQDLTKLIEPQLINIPGVQTRILQENSLNISGAGSGLRIALLGNSYDEIYDAAEELSKVIYENLPEVNDILIDFASTQPELEFTIDREKANDLKVPMQSISETLRALVDKNELFDINIDDQTIPIIISSNKDSIKNPQDILNIFVQNSEGMLIPLSTMITIKESGVSSELDRIDQRRAIELDIGLAQGESISKAVAKIQDLAQTILPSGITLKLMGEAAKIDETSYELAIVFVIAVIVVFLVLAAQFESWGSAIIVIFTLPFSLSAVVFALIITGQTLNLYSQIGLILLVGLMTKNSILLVEFMEQMRDQGMQISEAIMQAAKIRFRPIVMTVLATILGSIPLMVGTGAGSEARAAIGWVVFAGLGLSTIFTLYITPLGYSLIAPIFQARAQTQINLQAELDQANNERKDKSND